MTVKLRYFSFLLVGLLQLNLATTVSATTNSNTENVLGPKVECPTALLSYTFVGSNCAPLATYIPALSGTGSFQGGTFSCSSTDVTIDSISGVFSASKPGTFTIVYTLAASQNCPEMIVSSQITVNPSPVLSATTYTTCNLAPIQITASTLAAPTNAWTTDNPTIITVSTSGLVSFLKEGGGVVTFTSSTGCKAVLTVASSKTTITGAENVCVGGVISFTGSGTAATSEAWTSSNPNIATVSSSGLVVGIAEGTSTITYKNSEGCIVTKTIAVHGKPTIKGENTMCFGSHNQLTGSGNPANSSPWKTYTPTIVTITDTGIATGIGLGSGLINYTDSYGCFTTFQINVGSIQSVIAGKPQSVCSNGTITLEGFSSSSSAITTWDDGGLGGSFSDIHSLTSTYSPKVTTGTVTLTLTGVAQGSCPEVKDTMIVTLISNVPIVNAGDPQSLCAGNQIKLNGSMGGSTVSIKWDDGGAGGIFSDLNSLTTTYTPSIASGAVTLSLTLTGTSSNICPDVKDNVTLTILKTPLISGETSLCVSESSQYFPSEISNLVNPWLIDDVSLATISSGGLLKAVSFGIVNLSYTGSNGCIGKKKIIIEDIPIASVISDKIVQQINNPVTFAASFENSLFADFEWFINDVSQGNNDKFFTTSTLKQDDIVKVCTSNNCGTNCAIAPKITLGNEDKIWECFYFYPNPAAQYIYINNNQPINKIEIYTLLGQKIVEKISNDTSIFLDLRDLASGNYILKTTSNDKEKVSNLIKQ